MERSILLVDPEPSETDSDDYEDMLLRCLEFMCGLQVQSIVQNGSQYKVYLDSTSYDKANVQERLIGTDYISGCDIVV